MDSNCRLAGLRLAQPVDITLSNGRKGRFTPRLLDGRGTLGVLDFDTRSRGQETLASERGSTFRHAPPLPR